MKFLKFFNKEKTRTICEGTIRRVSIEGFLLDDEKSATPILKDVVVGQDVFYKHGFRWPRVSDDLVLLTHDEALDYANDALKSFIRRYSAIITDPNVSQDVKNSLYDLLALDSSCRYLSSINDKSKQIISEQKFKEMTKRK